MDDEAWLRKLLEACRAAAERLQDSRGPDERRLLVDVRQYCDDLERKLKSVADSR